MILYMFPFIESNQKEIFSYRAFYILSFFRQSFNEHDFIYLNKNRTKIQSLNNFKKRFKVILTKQKRIKRKYFNKPINMNDWNLENGNKTFLFIYIFKKK